MARRRWLPESVPTLLLEHVGRTSDKLYTTPLLYLEDGANLIVVASQAWPRLVELYADFAKYATWAAREIPVIVLEPR